MSVERRRIAAIVTEYRPHSHADVIVTKFLEGYSIDGQYHAPRVDVVSLYTDQVPDADMSRAMAAKHGVPIYPTIAEALTCGGDTLAVDGVLLIGEHGDYPSNEKGQVCYPRRRFFAEAAAVMRASGRAVPAFNDKHLSYSWEDAHWMVATARELAMPLMAGSSLPVTVRRPPLELPLGCPISEALVAGYGPTESYGFHALETLQCLVERRGESGVAAVRALQGTAVWEALDAGEWSPALLAAALARCEHPQAGNPRDNCAAPVAFQLRYRDGLRGTVLLLNGHLTEFGFAASLLGQTEPASTLIYLWEGQPYEHFAYLVRHIEEMFVTGRPQYPVERTLLVTGVLDACMDSLYRGQVWVETPHLEVAYLPSR
ncbi:MAG: hypothetical protein GX774_12510 [Armatimonadetes bacterium]|nr:hypothetical protein [Armatimonadota bacterium]